MMFGMIKIKSEMCAVKAQDHFYIENAPGSYTCTNSFIF